MSTDDQQKRGGLVPIGTVAVRLPGVEGRGRAEAEGMTQTDLLINLILTNQV